MQSHLSEGITKLGLAYDDVKLQQLEKYINLLLKWNKVYSLTAITDLPNIVNYHILDGLSVIQHLNAGASTILDVGSGMGVPGVILAIWYPEVMVTVLDANNKKTAFLQQVAIELQLSNLLVVCDRVEKYHPTAQFDWIVARAFTDARSFLTLTQHLAHKESQWMLMKSQQVFTEVEDLQQAYPDIAYNVIPVELPQLDATRYLLVFSM